MTQALEAIERDAKNPNLRPSVPLERLEENGLEFWLQAMTTRDETVMSCSAVVRGPKGVLIATMDAPQGPEAFQTFVNFLSSVKPLPEKADGESE